MVVSTSLLSFRVENQNLWAPGAAIELGIDSGDALIYDPDEFTYDIDIGGSFMGFQGQLYIDAIFGLFAYAKIGEVGSFGGGIDIVLNTEHNAVVTGNGEGITFNFDDYTITKAELSSNGFGLGAEAGLDLVIGFEFGFRDISYAIFGFQDTEDDFKIIDVPEQHISLIKVAPGELTLPFELGYGLTLNLRVPTGADTEGTSTGSTTVTSEGVSDTPFIELAADLDEMLITLLKKIPFPPLAAVANALENTIFAEFEFDLNDYVPGIGKNIFGVSATVLDIGASIGAAVSEDLSLDFSNGDGKTPDVTIMLRSDNGTAGDLSDDVLKETKLGATDVNIAGPNFDGFGPVKIDATFDLNRARFSHSIGIDLIGGFTIEALKASTTGSIGSKLGISFGPLLSVEFPEGGFRAELLNDLYTNSFDVADGAFNTVTDTYEVFYTRTVPQNIDLEKPGAIQELITYNETRQINIAASNLVFASIINGRPEVSYINAVAQNIANLPQKATWFADTTVGNADLDGGSVNVRDIVIIDVKNTTGVNLSALTASYEKIGFAQVFGSSSFGAAQATGSSGFVFLQNMPTPAQLNDAGTGGIADNSVLTYFYSGRIFRSENSVNILGNVNDDLLVYWGDEAQILDGGGQQAGSATGDVLIANFAASHPFDAIEWDLRPTAVGQTGQSVEMKFGRGPALFTVAGTGLTKVDGFINAPIANTVQIANSDPDGAGTLRTATLSLTGTHVVRLLVEDTGNGVSSFELLVRKANGTYVSAGTQVTNDSKPGEVGFQYLTFKDVVLASGDRLEIRADRGGATGLDAESARIQQLFIQEQHTVSFLNIESFMLRTTELSDLIFTSNFRDGISFGAGEDTLFLTADKHAEVMDMGSGSDIALIELNAPAALGMTTSTTDLIYGQLGSDEAIFRNVSNVGVKWLTSTPDPATGIVGTSGPFIEGPLGFDATVDQMFRMIRGLNFIWQDEFLSSRAVSLPQSNTPTLNIQLQLTSGGVTNSVMITEFEAISLEGSDTANDLAIYWGGGTYDGGDSLADTFAAEFRNFDRPVGTTTGVIISGYNATVSALIGGPLTSQFSTAPTLFTYDEGRIYANGNRIRVSEIKGFERLFVTGTGFDDILVGGVYDDFLIGDDGNDILVGGGSRNYTLGYSGFQNEFYGGLGADTFYTNGDERTMVRDGGAFDLLIFGAGGVLNAGFVQPVHGLQHDFGINNSGNVTHFIYSAASSAASLLSALDQMVGGNLFTRDFSFLSSAGLGAFANGGIRTNLTGLDETDDLFISDGGASYIGGERAGDTDTFAANFRGQTFGITLNVEQDVGGVILENGVYIKGMDRVVLRLGSGQDLVTGGAQDDVIYGGDGTDILRGGGSVNGDSLYGDNGADLFGWNVNDGISNVFGGTDAGDTPENPIVDRVLISSIDENGNSIAAPGAGLGVQLIMNAGGGATDFDPLGLGSITSANTGEDISRLLYVANPIGSPPNNVTTIRVWSGTSYVAMTGIEATEVQGSNEEDDLIWYQNGKFYDGGDRAGDKDVFVAVLLGETADLTIHARSGEDRVADDEIFSDIGNGTTIGNFEQILVRLGSGDDEAYGGDFEDLLEGNDGDDLLDGGAGNDTVSGGAGNDLLFYTSGSEIIDGGADNDILEMNAIPGGISSVYGFDIGTSTFTFFAEVYDITNTTNARIELSSLFANAAITDDFIVNGTGNSMRYTNIEKVIISAEEDRDMLVSGQAGGILSGDGGDDVLVSLGGNDLLVGGDGLDRYAFGGNWGDDVIGGEYFGTGEIYFFGWTRAQITFSLGAPGTDDLLISNGLGDTILFVDYFRNAANGLNYTFSFDDQVVTLDLTGLGSISSGAISDGNIYFGTDARDDMLEGTAGADAYFAREGNDLIGGSAGADIISGGLGLDAVIYQSMVVNVRALGVTVNLATGFGLGGDAQGDILISIEDALGSNGRDNLTGSDRRNALAGGHGNDSIFGGGGEDFLSGDGENDQLFGGDQDDVLFGGTGKDKLTGGADNDYLHGNEGVDKLFGGTGNDSVAGGDANDRANLGEGDDTYLIIHTVSGLVADAGLDTVDGGTGIDTIETNDFTTGVIINLGGEFDGAQTVTSNGVSDTGASGIFATLANLTGFENAVGSNLRDTILGSSAANKLAGASGDDLLLGFQGNDTIIGGAGIDTVSYAAEAGGGTVTVDLAAGTATDTFGNVDSLSEIEHVIGSNTSDYDDLFGDAGDNTFTGNKGIGVDQMDGRAGVDTVDYSLESDTQNYLPGGTTPGPIGVGVVVDLSVAASIASPNATDTSGHGDLLIDIENIIGSIRGDNITGSTADNLFVGGDGADTLNGGPGGFDTVDYSREAGTLGIKVDDTDPGTNRDTFGFVDVLVGMERIIGTSLVDIVVADDSFVREIIGGGGNDSLVLFSLGALPVVDGSRLFGGDGDDFVGGSEGADFLFGGSGENFSTGQGGNDIYLSTGGNDTFLGGAGDNTVSFELFAGAISVDLAQALRVPGIGAPNGFSITFTTDSISAELGTLRQLMMHTDTENVTGSAYADIIRGDGFANVLKGGGGNDTIYGDSEADTLDGGTGIDTLDYSAGFQGVSIDLTRTASNATDGFGKVETVVGFERLIGTQFNDTMKGDDKAQTFIAGAGFDSLDGGGGFDVYDLSQDIGALPATFSIGFDTLTGTITATVTDVSGAIDVLTGIEHFIGGNSAYDDMFGSDGDETFTGNAGDEIDQIFGGAGIDTADYGSEGGTLGAVVDLRIAGSASNPNATDTFGDGDGLQGIENLIGSAQGDLLIGGGDANLFVGMAGDDTLSGGAGEDSLDGGTGIDTLDYSFESGLQGVAVDLSNNNAQDTFGDLDILRNIEIVIGTELDDAMLGSASANLLFGLGGADVLDGWEGNDTVDGGAGLDVVLGWKGDDSLLGGADDDTLEGEAGNDTLLGGAGQDVIKGGDGFDTASYAGSLAGVTVTLVDGAATGIGGDAAGDILTSIENLTGSDLADKLYGDDAANLIEGGLGTDTVLGGAGADTLNGGADNDILSYAGSDAAVVVSLANLTATGGHATGDVISGFEGIIGSNRADQLTGNASANQLNGGAAGADTLTGGAGDDIYIIDASDVVVELGGGGRDLIRIATTYTLLTKFEDLELTGSTAINGFGNTVDNRLTGNSAANLLDGGEGRDTLTGGGGADTLNGGLGADQLSGEAGADVFVFSTALGSANFDVITGYSAADDRIELASAIFSTVTGGPIAGTAFTSNTTGLATSIDHRIIYNSANGALFYDSDGQGGAAGVQFAKLDANLAMTAGEFFVL